MLTQQQSLDRSKFERLVDNTLFHAAMARSVFYRTENVVRKGENAGDQHFLLFSQCFGKASSSRLLKNGVVWYQFKQYMTKPEKAGNKHFSLYFYFQIEEKFRLYLKLKALPNEN